MSGCPARAFSMARRASLAGGNHFLGGGGVMGLGMPDHMDDVRSERHLQVDAGRQVGSGSFGVEGIA